MGEIIRTIIMAAGLLWAAANAQHSLVIIGSSTAAGVGASTYDSAFAGRYAKYLPTLSGKWTMTNLAVGGYTTYQLMPTGFKPPTGRPAPETAHNMTKALSLHPDVLLLALGDNDIGNNYAPTEYQSNYDSLKSAAVKAGVRIWITTTVPRTALDSSGRLEVLAFRKRILERYAPNAIDFFDGLGSPDGKYLEAYNSGDGIHTNDKGHRILFNKVVAAKLTDLPSTTLTTLTTQTPLAAGAGWRGETGGRALLSERNGSLIFTDGRSALGFNLQGRAAAALILPGSGSGSGKSGNR